MVIYNTVGLNNVLALESSQRKVVISHSSVTVKYNLVSKIGLKKWSSYAKKRKNADVHK